MSKSMDDQAGSKARGHLFVLLGKIGGVVADAAVIPTDRDFTVEHYWSGVTGKSVEDMRRNWRPSDWAKRGYATAPKAHQFWFLDVTRDSNRDDTAQTRLVEMLDHIARWLRGRAAKSPKRVRPLVLIPVIGVGQGGESHHRGRVIGDLLANCSQFVASHAVDVALVTPNRSVHGALQHARRRDPDRYFPDLALEVDEKPASREAALGTVRDLAEQARRHSLSLLLGAGASVPAGLPSWDELLDEIAGSTLTKEDRAILGHLDAAQFLQQAEDGFQNKVAEIIRRHKTPAPSHLLLAALGCRQAITTNYDTLYEDASNDVPDPSATGKVVAVLPHSYPGPDQRWLLKMHGTVTKPESIVLTRAQFAGYDAASRPAGSVLQAVLLTSHLLVVGTSMTDDNVLRLVHEVLEYRKNNAEDVGTSEPLRLGTVLDVSGSPLRRRLHGRAFRWCVLPGENVSERAINLEILLDAVSAFAADDTSWLLDRRFADLLTNGAGSSGQETAGRLRDLVRSLPQTPEWAELRKALAAFGASAT